MGAVLAGAVSAQDLRVVASVDRPTVGMEETLAFTVEIQGQTIGPVEVPEPPQADGLRLLQSAPSRSTQTSIVNGRVSQSVAFTWYLRPAREGEATIASTTVRAGDRTWSTDPISVRVVPQGTGPPRSPVTRTDPFAAFRDPFAEPDPGEADAPDERDLFIRVVPSRTTVVQNEQVTVRYELFFREGIQLRQSRLTDSWDAEGFWAEDLEVDARPVPRMVVEKGLRYNTITLKRAALFPTHAGDLSVDPLRIETEAVLPTRSRDPIAQLFSLSSRYAKVELESSPLTLYVEPLPSAVPAGFAGAVGRYRLEVRADRTTVPVGGSLQLVITVSGSGNLATLAPPAFDLPGAFERYDPQVKVDLDRSGDAIHGSKTYTFVLVARSHGQFEIPPVTFVHFDPSEGRYVASTSPSLPVTVTGDAGLVPAARATAGGLPVDDIAGPMSGEVRWIRTRGVPLHRSGWPYLVLALPALVVGAYWAFDRRARYLAAHPALGRLRRAHPLARRHLRRATALLEAGQARAFYEELAGALLGFVGNRLDVAERGLTRHRLAGVLTGRGVEEGLVDELVAFLDACDLARFSPVVPGTRRMADDREVAGSLLVRLDSALAAA